MRNPLRAHIMHPLLTAGWLLLLLVGCAPSFTQKQTAEAAAPKTFVFVCSDSYEFVARIKDNEAWLFLPARTIQTFKVADDLYQSTEATLQLTGEESTVDSADGYFMGCRNDRRRAIWEHAKLSGADFRAVGNEPGWYLEIRAQARIVLVTNYGMERYEFNLPEAETDTATRTTRYSVAQNGHDLSIILRSETCQDTMSGEPFETTVEVLFNGQTLNGCGRSLH